MRSSKAFLAAAVIGLTMLGYGGVALAIPTLQLDAIPGHYFDGTTYSTDNPFTLRAILNPEGDKQNSNRPPATLYEPGTNHLAFFYVSIALVPQVDFQGTLDLGSFTYTYKGVTNTVNVTSDMKYGLPPIENVLDLQQPKDPGDLPKHGVFPTYYTEIKFQFDPTPRTLYNVADDSLGNGDAFYQEFNLDISALDTAYALHFDLYNKYGNGDKDIGDFAPFSHDAETNGKVPEAGAAALFLTGMVSLIAYRRKKRLD